MNLHARHILNGLHEFAGIIHDRRQPSPNVYLLPSFLPDEWLSHRSGRMMPAGSSGYLPVLVAPPLLIRIDILNGTRFHADKIYSRACGLTAQVFDEPRSHTRTVYESGTVRVLERPSQP